MRRMGWMGIVCALAAACDGPVATDAGTDAGPDAGGEDAGGGVEQIALAGLDGPVEVIVDDRGMPHIYATTVHDLLMVQGYLMARDRFIQMEFIRRGVTGRLAEVLGGLDPSLVEDDQGSRFLGFGRTGREIYESLPATDRTRLVAEAFVEGINAYIDGVVLDPEYQPPRGLEVFNAIRVSPSFGHWEPADIFALARYQAWNLSYDAGADINRTRALTGARAAFDAADSDERLAARAGIFADFFSERQARRVYTRDGFNDGTTDALLPGLEPVRRPRLPRPRAEVELASIELLDRGARFFERLERHPYLARDPHVGSNSWVVHGDITESGNPILSNDPHLSLISPGVWWYVHLNTARMGGEDAIDVQGVSFAGLPGVVLGYNRDLAWSATTTGYDVTDVYAETVTFENTGSSTEPVWVPRSVRFDDGTGARDVALTTITETIGVAGGGSEDFVIYVAPHHGPLIPETIAPPASATETEGTAMSVRYTGHVVTNELAFFVGLMTATSVDDAAAAQDHFRVGAQNFSFASRGGDIAWSTESRVPQRQAAACSFAVETDGTISGVSPLFVLPGEGGFEWTTDLEERFIPHDRNPARGYIATANQDNVGVTDDGNPCNDDHYIGGGFAPGYRMFRIDQRLAAMAEAGNITADDMIELQAETRSSLGEGLRDAIVASLAHAIGDTSDDAALDAVMTAAGAEGVADLTAVRDRLAAWSFATPHAAGATDADEIADSVATTLFNAIMTRLTRLAFDDETARIGRGPGSGEAVRMLEWAMADAAAQQALPLYTFREDYAGITGWNDTVVWDDLGTDAVVETRDERVASAALAAIAWLEGQLGADWGEWRWGRLHAVRFGQIVPPAGGPAIVSIPPEGSSEFPLGFPRHGDYGAVDVGNFGMGGERFTHGSGASQRVVVEMTPDGPRPFNALPGGQSEDVDSPHHADEAELWRSNQQPPLYFEQGDVEAHAGARLRFAAP